MTGLSIPGEHVATSGAALRAKLHRQAREIAPMLPGNWAYMVSVNANGASARVVFAEIDGKGRIIITAQGKLAAISVSDKRLARRVSGVLQRGIRGAA